MLFALLLIYNLEENKQKMQIKRYQIIRKS